MYLLDLKNQLSDLFEYYDTFFKVGKSEGTKQTMTDITESTEKHKHDVTDSTNKKFVPYVKSKNKSLECALQNFDYFFKELDSEQGRSLLYKYRHYNQEVHEWKKDANKTEKIMFENESKNLINNDLIIDNMELGIDEIGINDKVLSKVCKKKFNPEKIQACNNKLFEIKTLSEVKNTYSSNKVLNFTFPTNKKNFNDLGSSFLIFTLHNLDESILNFCEISYNNILYFKNDDHLFMSEYLIRYNSYIESAIHINELYEHLVILVNYVYDYFFPIKANTSSETLDITYPSIHQTNPHFVNSNDINQSNINITNEVPPQTTEPPKYSILRHMINKWNEIVLEPLAVKLASKGLKLLQKIIEDDLNKSLKEIMNQKSKVKNKCDSHLVNFSFGNTKNKKIAKTMAFKRIDFKHKDESIEKENFDFEETKEEKIQADLNQIYQDKNFKKNLRLFQSITTCLVDNSCNEYSVLILNTDYFSPHGIYSSYEKSLLKVVLKTIDKYSTLYTPYCLMTKLISMQVLQEKLLNTTKIKICKLINQVVFDRSVNCLLKEIDLYMKKLYSNHNNDIQALSKIVTNYFKLQSFNINPELSSIFKILEDHIKIKESNDSLVLYIIANFINTLKDQPIDQDIIRVIQESNKWFEKVLETQDYYNKQVNKELKRRKITGDEIMDLVGMNEYWSGEVSKKTNLCNEILELNTKNKIDDIFESMMLYN